MVEGEKNKEGEKKGRTKGGKEGRRKGKSARQIHLLLRA
jgi:hypothetical protein